METGIWSFQQFPVLWLIVYGTLLIIHSNLTANVSSIRL